MRPRIDPVVWRAPAPPPRARLRASRPPMPTPILRSVGAVGAVGPEDVAVHPDGGLYTGVEDGRILRLPLAGGPPVEVADTGGRPLGVEVSSDGDLVVSDAYRGLLRVSPTSGAVEVLADGFRLCDNAAVARDGTIYFSDSSQRHGLAHWRADILEHTGTGRLLRRSPSGSVSVVLEGLQFANGVALAADESFVAVAETGAYRISRVWLTGPRAGDHDVLIDNLPGFPDNLSTGADGRIWIALATLRNPALDRLHALPPALRRLVWSLPTALQPAPARTTWVMAVNGAGEVVADLQTSDADYHMVTGVREHEGTLYLGSLVETSVAVVSLA
ncbi:SMP-30/gluconolactonase/LRE family protein [Asanoa sp. WMMD1127]|uniref:SMP-30/gluconolactonase/LRE family protein n=1 Tax=Asanoa sp. WMMD1127 TaxID=3016107 RepID=UPI002417F448|nr:SMP-30/gluconolactonase/LRE family protein [Asanoa sp. WMMD1127]MDG4827581.1 SMP-30/gluconolactonase/LRE family protein [Asanoa sp. WMMD1127]